MMTISQNLFRRHRGTRGGETLAQDAETRNYDSSSSSNNNPNGSNNNNNNNTSNGDNTDNNEEGTTSATSSSIMMTSLNHHDVENTLTENNNINTGNNSNEEEATENDDDNDEVQELVVRIPSNNSNSNTTTNEPSIQFPNWTLNETEVNTRREAIRTEVERMQHSNFIHFAVLCLVPTSLLLIVIAAILSEDGECGAEDDYGLTVCEREPRTFVNAFTTRCICDAVGSVLMKTNGGVDGDDGEDP